MTGTTCRPTGRRWSRTAIPLGVAALLTLGGTAGPAPATAASATGLTPPTGRDRIGVVRLHLVDPARVDPISPTHGVRELMVQAWYPATDTQDFPVAPYEPPLAAAHLLARLEAVGARPGTTLPPTVTHTGAPVDRRHGPRPVILYSPGGGADASFNTGLVEELVSHGYIVVSMDDTNESPEVEFPGGRLVLGAFPLDTEEHAILAQGIRAADARFVLNELAVLNRGGNPDAENAPLPRGLAGSLDLNHVGMFGWSIGGAASAQAMHDDPSIKAGIDMDGTIFGPLPQQGVNRPFMVMSEPVDDDTIAAFRKASTGPKPELVLSDSAHDTFVDFEDIVPELGLPAEAVKADIGAVNPRTAVADERAYLRAFYDKYLRHRDNHLLDGPSPRFPDIHFVP